ncbi:hypothetical protein RA11412_0527 [Rothia aeria]|uniref:Uncharacterized protein n=1 Tax=Rothia aeria TaxID=172042 RepID=A0A2Z5QWX9_9MICC|nr:hypothetical protein RA11412_0527 [Rothia aeria]
MPYLPEAAVAPETIAGERENTCLRPVTVWRRYALVPSYWWC